MEPVNPYASPELPPETLSKTAPPQASPETRIVVISVAICVIYHIRQFIVVESGGILTLPITVTDWLSLTLYGLYGAQQGLGLAILVLAGSRKQLYSIRAFRRWIKRLAPGHWISLQGAITLISTFLVAVWSQRPDPLVGKSLDSWLQTTLDFGLQGGFLLLVVLGTREKRTWRIAAALFLCSLGKELLVLLLRVWAPAPDGWFEPWYWTFALRLESFVFFACIAVISVGVGRDLHFGQWRDNLHWAAVTIALVYPLAHVLRTLTYTWGL